MTEIKDNRIEQFLEALASQSATPGGGSAAAIIGAMGAALVSMVCNLTIGKKKYAEVEGDMKNVLAEADALRKQLIGMIEDDVKAFDAVMGAYGLPKETDADKAKRDQAIQAALNKINTLILDDHLHHCVTTAVRGEDPAERERVLSEIANVFETAAKI